MNFVRESLASWQTARRKRIAHRNRMELKWGYPPLKEVSVVKHKAAVSDYLFSIAILVFALAFLIIGAGVIAVLVVAQFDPTAWVEAFWDWQRFIEYQHFLEDKETPGIPGLGQ